MLSFWTIYSPLINGWLQYSKSDFGYGQFVHNNLILIFSLVTLRSSYCFRVISYISNKPTIQYKSFLEWVDLSDGSTHSRKVFEVDAVHCWRRNWFCPPTWSSLFNVTLFSKFRTKSTFDWAKGTLLRIVFTGRR